MYRKFAFEGEVHEKLDCVPLTVRRKLDLAAFKISLKGWQDLPHEERLALCHLPVDAAEDLDVYRDVFQGFARAHGVLLSPLPPSDPKDWAPDAIPARVAERLGALGRAVSATAWAKLGEEERYAVFKYADPRKEPAKLEKLLDELGF